MSENPQHRDFIFRIGPIEAADGSTSFFHVHPGLEDSLVFEAQSFSEAAAAILEVYASSELECEPDLAAEAAHFGIAAGEIDDQRAHAIALMAFDTLEEAPFTRVDREGLIFQFGRSAAVFWEEAPWKRRRASQPIELEVLGSASFDAVAVILGGGDAVRGIAIYDDHASLAEATRLFRMGKEREAALIDTLGVVFQGSPSFAVDAMRRAHGFEQLPMPVLISEGTKVRVADHDVAVLAAAMQAIAHLAEDAEIANGRVRVEDIEIVVNARWASSAWRGDGAD